MSVKPATLMRAESSGTEAFFVPPGGAPGTLETHGYVEEEWIAAGEALGASYRTTLLVRRPRDPARFSGTLIVEPVHAMGAVPIWMYTSSYQMRSGHACACVCSQKSALEAHVKRSNPERYASLEIASSEAREDRPSGPGRPTEPDGIRAWMQRMRAMNAASTPILAQTGAALRDTGPLADWGVRHVILVGHSQTGGVVTEYTVSAHQTARRSDGAPIYDGLFPSGAPSVRFGPRDVPLVQTLSEGDIADPRRPGREGRGYRRADGDDPEDRYRLYELAGLPHMGTRYPPYNDPAMWAGNASGTAGRVPADARMNSLPHGELFSMTLDHLVRWVDGDRVPPRAERMEVDEDGLFVKDEVGNSRGGVRCAQMDVPRLRYLANPGTTEDGRPARGVVGFEEPLSSETLRQLYGTHGAYVAAFERRLEALIEAGWMLRADAEEMRAEASSATF